MMDKKKLYIIITAAVLTASVFAGIGGAYLHAGQLAMADVEKETERVTAANDALKIRRDILKNDVGSKTDDTEHKNNLNKQIAELTEKIAAAKSDAEKTEKSAKDYQSRADSVTKTYNTLRSGMNLTEGDSVTVGESETLSCPSDINAGRYIATGGGTITIIAGSGSARAAEDLKTIDTNSYTFDLSDGENVEVNGSVILTELK